MVVALAIRGNGCDAARHGGSAAAAANRHSIGGAADGG
jgi:hypothetical protein